MGYRSPHIAGFVALILNVEFLKKKLGRPTYKPLPVTWVGALRVVV